LLRRLPADLAGKAPTLSSLPSTATESTGDTVWLAAAWRGTATDAVCGRADPAATCVLSGRAERSGTRRFGSGMPGGRPRGLPELPLAKTPARHAREAERDQAQVIEIPGIAACDTGDSRTAQADRLRFPASAGSGANKADYISSRYVRVKGAAGMRSNL